MSTGGGGLQAGLLLLLAPSLLMMLVEAEKRPRGKADRRHQYMPGIGGGIPPMGGGYPGIGGGGYPGIGGGFPGAGGFPGRLGRSLFPGAACSPLGARPCGGGSFCHQGSCCCPGGLRAAGPVCTPVAGVPGGLPITPMGGTLTAGIPPFGGGIRPIGGGIPPFGGGIRPIGGGIPPYGGGVSPYGGGVSPFGGGIPPFGGGIPAPLGLMGGPGVGGLPIGGFGPRVFAAQALPTMPCAGIVECTGGSVCINGQCCCPPGLIHQGTVCVLAENVLRAVLPIPLRPPGQILAPPAPIQTLPMAPPLLIPPGQPCMPPAQIAAQQAARVATQAAAAAQRAAACVPGAFCSPGGMCACATGFSQFGTICRRRRRTKVARKKVD